MAAGDGFVRLSALSFLPDQILNPRSRMHFLWASIRSEQFSCPFSIMHLSLACFVSGHAQHGNFYFSKTPPLASMHCLSFFLNLSTEQAFLIVSTGILLHSEFTEAIRDALLGWETKQALCRIWFQAQLSSGDRSGVQFNSHLGFRVVFRDKFRGKFNFGN